MGFNIEDLLNLNQQQQDQSNLPPVPLRDDYKPAPVNPMVLASLAQKYPQAKLPQAAPAPEEDDSESEPAPQAPSALDQFKDKFSADKYKQAQQDSQDQKSGLGWTQFAAGLGDAIAGRSSAQTAQNFDNIRKGIDDRTVGAFEKQKAAAVQDIGTKKAFEGGDPNSEKSKVVQQTIQRLWGDKFTPEQVSKITADDADLVYKPMELKSKLDQTKAAQEMAHEYRMARNQDRASKSQGDAYQKASHDVNTFRGNSAVQQAATALTNAQNALSLANKGKLSPDQLHLFASEMGKLATGGVPGHSEIEALIPNTAKTQLAKVTQFFSNSPSDADAQAFINNNKQYLNELVHNYRGVVNSYRDNILNGYKKKLSPEDMADLKSRNPYAEPAQDSGKPKTVTQNGHTFTLNPQTGEYE